MTPSNTDSGSQIKSIPEYGSGSGSGAGSGSGSGSGSSLDSVPMSAAAFASAVPLYSDLSRINRRSGKTVAKSAKRTAAMGAGAGNATDSVISGDDNFVAALQQLKTEEADLIGERYLQFVFTDDDRIIPLDKELFGDGLRRDNNRETMMLEFLLVFSCQDRNLPFDQAQKDQYGRVVYLKRRQHLLRRIIFNNPFLQTVLESNASNEQKWMEWRRLFINFNAYTRHTDPVKTAASADSADSAESAESTESNDDLAFENTASKQKEIFCYSEDELRSLEQDFPSFERFVQAVSLMRSWSLNFESDSQWVYKYLFPFGYETLFCEMRSTYDADVGLDYIRQSSNYMSGCGDFVFSMLQRACEQAYDGCLPASLPYQVDTHKAQFIATALRQTFFLENNPINSLAERLACRRSCYERELMYKLQEPQQDFALKDNILAEQALEPTYQDAAHKANLAVTRMLSVKHHRVFKQLAEDYYNILHLNLSVQDQFTTLGTISMLNLMVFLLEIGQGALSVAQRETGTGTSTVAGAGAGAGAVEEPQSIDMVVSIKASKRTRLHQMSQQCLRVNQGLIKDCLGPYAAAHATAMMRKIAPDMLTRPSLNAQELSFCEGVLKRLFNCSNKVSLSAGLTAQGSNTNSLSEPNTYAADAAPQAPAHISFNDLLTQVQKFIEQNGSSMEEVHQRYGRSIGLIPATNSSRGNSLSYYTFTDELVRILVYCILGTKRHLLFEDFVAQLYARYHLVIGVNEATRYYQSARKDPNFVEQKEFADNASEFKEQLRRLDLLLSLSDGFDYVCNPYGTV